MDNLTHSLVGAHLARFPRFRGLPERTALWTSVVASNLPDLDHLLRLGGETTYLFGHRGTSHSLLALALLAPAVGAIAAALTPAPRQHLAGLVSLAVAGLSAHLLLDSLTSLGVSLLAPFSQERLALAWLYVADAWVWAALGLPLIWGWWKKRRGPIPARVLGKLSAASLLAVSVYVAAAAVAKERARWAAVSQLPQDLGEPLEVLAYPAPFGPLIWTTLVRTDERLWHRGFASILTGGVTDGGTFSTGVDDPRLQIALETPAGERYRRFAAALYRAKATELEDDGSFEVALGDLRFSDPFSDRLPLVLWMRIGPAFDVESVRVRTAILPHP